MLDRASIEKLAQTPELNDPVLNVALAEEGAKDVLLRLASCRVLGAEALAVIASRAARAEDDPAFRSDPSEDPEELVTARVELDRKLVEHPNAPDHVRDQVMERREADPYFLLAAAVHERATEKALERCASVAARSPLHDRPWISLLRGQACEARILAAWARKDEFLREAAALLSADVDLLAALARDPARRVRRAVASNDAAASVARELLRDDAPEIRARAAAALAGGEEQGSKTAREAYGTRAGAPAFAAALSAMDAGGTLSYDAVRALLNAGPDLDEEGAMLAALHFDKDGLLALVNSVTASEHDAESSRGIGVATGLALRAAGEQEEGAEDGKSLTQHLVHLVTRQPTSATRLTGKARVAFWLAESLARSSVLGEDGLYREAQPGSMAYDRMVLLRSVARRAGTPGTDRVLPSEDGLPLSLIELAWRDPNVNDDHAVALAACARATARRDRELPEDELDLAPSCRPLPVLERAVMSAIARAAVSPRAALTAIALEPRRIRYVLSAMPTWRGVLTGVRVARVLRAHAGALSAAAPSSSGAHAAGVARWTDRKLVELEAAIAIAVGDLTTVELLRRLGKGLVVLNDGVALAAAVEARAAIDGAATFAPLLAHAAANRTTDASALALWVLLESLDRPRPASLIASAIDGLSGARSVVPPGVCEALATLERRGPGRLDSVFPQSPRGRATVASAIARAYRALGGMRDEV